MTTYHFDLVRQIWVLKCGVCLHWFPTIYETADGDQCRRCLNQPDLHKGRAA